MGGCEGRAGELGLGGVRLFRRSIEVQRWTLTQDWDAVSYLSLES